MKHYMKNNIVKVLTILFVLVLANSCKKYTEGPDFTLRTKRSRLAGEWKVAEYYVNNIDDLSALPTGVIEISKKYGVNYYWGTRDKFAEVNNVSTKEREGFVGFVNEGDYLCFLPEKSLFKNFMYSISIVNNDTIQSSVYQIIKLTKKEVKLQSIDYAIEKKEIVFRR